ncbi:MAG: hypothetical protein AB2392_14640 [Neobacillus sp.]
MKKSFISLFVLAFIFSFNLLVFADKGHDDSKPESSEVTETETQTETETGEIDHTKEAEEHLKEAEKHSKEAEKHSNDANSHSDGKENQSTEDKEKEHEEEADDGHHGPVVETPPNYKVLGTYGAVNLSFILIGVWTKWFRRKGK